MSEKEKKPDFYNVDGLVFIPAYDREEGIYRDLTGNVLPSVSEIMKPLFTMSIFAQEVETVVHKLIEAHLNDEPYGKPFKANCMAYLSAFHKWNDETRPGVRLAVMGLACSKFAAKLDFFGLIDGELWVIDWTTAALKLGVGVKLAAYSMLARSWYEQQTGKIRQINRGALQLNGDGNYIFKKYESLEDYEIFNHLLALKRWEMTNKQS